MPNSRQLSDLSRQELYELIWSSPITQIAADFGISDVAVHKRCIRLNVPRPTRGYWAKLAAGRDPRKKPLPPTAGEVFIQMAQRPIKKTLALPVENRQLHPLALQLIKALAKAPTDSFKRAHFSDEVTLPNVTASKALGEKVARAFHVILNELEPLGILFCKFQGTHSGGYFRRGVDRLYTFIDETLVDKLGTERRVPYWRSEESGMPSGRLIFIFKTNRYGQSKQMEWMETAKGSLEKLLPQIISGIQLHYLELHKQHVQEAIESKRRHAEWEENTRKRREEEAIRIQKEKELKHINSIKSAAETRGLDLVKAAEWWRKSRLLKEFVDECERRWRMSSGELNSEQNSWLTWANEIVGTLSPFTVGYPDPAKHGAFDASSIPFGGPYPSAQNFSEPPEMPIVQQPG